MNSDEFRRVASCLSYGIVLPAEAGVVYEVCAKSTIIFASLMLHAQVTRKTIRLYIMTECADGDLVTKLNAVHPNWIDEVAACIDHRKSEIIALFEEYSGKRDGTTVYQLSANTKVIAEIRTRPCSWCKAEYECDVNRHRCESSHVNRKRMGRSTLPMKEMMRFWDSLPKGSRRMMFFSTCLFLPPVPQDVSAEEEPFVRMVTGDIPPDTISGAMLLECLETVTEFTASWKMVREPLKSATMHHRVDFVAAMASAFIDRLASGYATRVANALMSSAVISDARILNNVSVICKPLSYCVRDLDLYAK